MTVDIICPIYSWFEKNLAVTISFVQWIFWFPSDGDPEIKKKGSKKDELKNASNHIQWINENHYVHV